MEIFSAIYTIVITLSLGTVLGYFVRQWIAIRQLDTIEARIKKLTDEAKTEAKEILLAAKAKAVKVLEDIKKEESEQRRELLNLQRRLENREETLEQRTLALEKEKESFGSKILQIKKLKEEVEEIKAKQVATLEKVAALTTGEAKKIIFKKVEERYSDELVKKIKALEAQEQDELNKKAREIITLAVQRCSISHFAETTTSILSLPSDEVKGRIIGREGRNVKTLESLVGVEIIVDDTPETIIISGFDPVRRQIAKLALEKLILDGRIHPARIEETIEETKKEIALKIKEAGEAVVYEIGIAGIHPKIVHLLGRLRFRTSYGQNVLIHSLEVAHLSGALAGELGADITLAKKAGLLHDIGKAVDQEIEGNHVEIGRNILRKFGVSEEVIKAMQSHHEDYPFESTEALIVAAADAISASRPGARKDTLENYLKRLKDLEAVANSFAEVEKSYAISAGREIRVFVKADKLDDLGAFKLSRQIADKIEEQLEYPGEIKVHVIRETRAVEYAR